MPTIPIRRQLYTGRRIVPTYYYYQHEPVQLPGWHQLYNEDVTLAEVLTEAGYATALIADLPHLQRPGRNFHRGYRYFEWVRGQEIDYYGFFGLVSGRLSEPAAIEQAVRQRPGISCVSESVHRES
jgi:arylsulfatase A-like enzyme